MEADRDIFVRKTTLTQQGSENDLAGLTPEQRMEMVWPLRISARAMKGEDIASQRLQRHVECVERRKR